MDLLNKRSWLVGCLLLAVGCAAAQTPVSAPFKERFDEARQVFQGSKEALKAAEGEKKRACDNADLADKALFDYAGNDGKRIEALAALARTERAVCRTQASLVDAAKARDEQAGELLRRIASDLGKCDLPQASCQALNPTTQDDLTRLRADLGQAYAPLYGSTAAPSPDAKRAQDEVTRLLTEAKGAQDRVTKLKGSVKDAWAVGDSAAKRALELLTEKSPQAAMDANVSGQGLQAFTSAVQVYSASGKAQSLSNTLVTESLKISPLCKEQGVCSVGDRVAMGEASAALTGLNVQENIAESARKRGKEALYDLNASGKDLSPAQKRHAVDFARMLDKFDDAKSLFGNADAFKLTASTKGNNAAIRIALGKGSPAVVRDAALILETPKDAGGVGKPFAFPDGLAKSTTVQFVTSAWKVQPSKAVIAQIVGAVKLGHERFSYLDSGKSNEEATVTRMPWSVSAASALWDLDSKRPWVHVLKAGWQRAYTEADKEIRCPVRVEGFDLLARCTQARFQAPSRNGQALVSYEARIKFPDFSIAPSVVHNLRTSVTDVNLPIYLIKSSDVEGKSPFNGGLNLGWNSTSGVTFGVFVGAAFSLTDIGR